MSDINPYQSPASPPQPVAAQPDEDARLFEATQILGQTKPWVRFLSVLGLLMFGLTIVGVGALVLLTNSSDPITFPLWLVPGMIAGTVLGYLIPSLLLWRYATRIDRYQKGQTTGKLADAVAAQRVFWKYLGIVGILGIIYTVGFRVMQFLGWNPVG